MTSSAVYTLHCKTARSTEKNEAVIYTFINKFFKRCWLRLSSILLIAAKNKCVRKETIRRKRGGCIFLFLSIFCFSSFSTDLHVPLVVCHLSNKRWDSYNINGADSIKGSLKWTWLFVQQDSAQKESRQTQYPALKHCLQSTTSPASSTRWPASLFLGCKFSCKALGVCRFCGLVVLRPL